MKYKKFREKINCGLSVRYFLQKIGIFRNKFAEIFLCSALQSQNPSKKNLGNFITKNQNFFVETTGQIIRKFNFLTFFDISSNTINIIKNDV
jgi:hypothetical protein